MTDNSPSRYKWYILVLGTATHILAAGIPNLCMPVLFEEISNDVGLSVAQIGMIWGMVGLPGLFTAFFVGMLGPFRNQKKHSSLPVFRRIDSRGLMGAATRI
jgi:hypothetical protein